MQDQHTLLFMGDPAHAETFRCRIYGPPAAELGDPPGLHVEDHSTVDGDRVRPAFVVAVRPRDPRAILEHAVSAEAARATAWAWHGFLVELLGAGAIDCPANDRRVARLKILGWLPRDPDFEPNPDGPGRIGRWRPTAEGLAALGHLTPKT